MDRGIREAANAYLEGLTKANEALMSTSRYPPLYRSGVGYTMGDVTTLPLAQTVQRRKRAACGPLAAYRAAELRREGDSGAVAMVRPSKSGIPGRWHAVVVRGDGIVEDPSAIVRGEAEVVGGWWGSLKKGLKAGIKGAASFGTGGASDLALKALGQKTSVEEGLGILKSVLSKGKAGKGGIPKSAVDKEPPSKAAKRAAAEGKPHVETGKDSEGPYAAVTLPLAGTYLTVVRRGERALPDALLRARQVARDPAVSPYVDKRAALAIDAASAAVLTGDVPAVLGALGRAAGRLSAIGVDTRFVGEIGHSLPAVVRACR